MNKVGARIESSCERFVCRVCRTKTGWRHQRWCELSANGAPSCKDCRYWSDENAVCEHPAARKGGVR